MNAATPLELLLARILGDVGNFTLGLDPKSRLRLTALEGSCVRFEILPPGGGSARPLSLQIADGQLCWQASASLEPNAIVRGSLPDIVALLGNSHQAAGVLIEGNEALLSELGSLLRQLQPDLARPMGELVGRDLADSLVGFAEAGVAFLKSAAEGIVSTEGETTRATFLRSDDFSRLLNDMESLSLRVDRLAARVAAASAARNPD